jgi:hypothetical protein
VKTPDQAGRAFLGFASRAFMSSKRHITLRAIRPAAEIHGPAMAGNLGAALDATTELVLRSA